MRFGRVLFGIVLALVVVGVVAGIGFTAYNAGLTQGIYESGKLVPPAADGSVVPTAPMMAPFGYYRGFGFGGYGGFGRPFGFGFGFLGCLAPLLFFFLIFGLFRFVFRPHWGRGWGGRGWGGGPGMRGGWGDTAEGDIPPAVREFHRKLHEEENTTPPPPAATTPS